MAVGGRAPKLDDDLTRLADVVFVPPQALLEPRRQLNSPVHFSAHGVDFELFFQARVPGSTFDSSERA